MGWIYYLITWILSMSYLVILHLSGKTVTVGSVSVLEVWVCLRDFLHPLSSFCLFIFYFCCFFQSKTLFFFFFLAFHVFIQVDGFAAIENFLPICITVWSVLLYVCKVLLYNGALSHSLQPTCCCSVPLSHVVRRSIGAKSAIMRGAVFAQTCTFSWTRATYTWILLL